jgi:hypothetical protein
MNHVVKFVRLVLVVLVALSPIGPAAAQNVTPETALAASARVEEACRRRGTTPRSLPT